MSHLLQSRRLAGLAAAAIAVVSLSACQSGQDAFVSQPYDPVDGRNVNLPEDATVGDEYVAIRAAQVVVVGDTHLVSATVVNNTEVIETLESISIAGTPAELSDGSVDILPGQSIHIGPNGDATAIAVGLDAEPGMWVEAGFSFATQGTAEFPVLAVPLGESLVE